MALLYLGGNYLAGRVLGDLGVLLILALVLFVAAPLFLLALLGVTARLPWLVGIALTAIVWGLVFVEIVAPTGVGANIGLGFLMIVSPLLIAGGALAVAKLTGSLPNA